MTVQDGNRYKVPIEFPIKETGKFLEGSPRPVLMDLASSCQPLVSRGLARDRRIVERGRGGTGVVTEAVVGTE